MPLYFNLLTISTAVLAHSIPPAHELQHGVKVATDRLKAVSDGVQSPVPSLVLCLCTIRSLTWWCCSSSWVLSLLTDGAVDEEAQQEQEGSEKGPAGHPGAQ